MSSKGRCNAVHDHSQAGSWVAFVVHGCQHERRWSGGSGGSAVRRSATSVGHSVGSREPFTTSCQPVGGIPPPSRTRSRRSLTLTEREESSRGLAPGLLRAADRRAPESSAIDDQPGGATERWPTAVPCGPLPTRGPGTELGVRHPVGSPGAPLLRALVAEKLAADWSPQQIAGWLKRPFPTDPCLHVSHETISLSLVVQSRGGLKNAPERPPSPSATAASVPARQPGGPVPWSDHRRRLDASASGGGSGSGRARPHWEGDVLTGARHAHLATRVERHARVLRLIRLAGTDTATVVRGAGA